MAAAVNPVVDLVCFIACQYLPYKWELELEEARREFDHFVMYYSWITHVRLPCFRPLFGLLY
jgi:hypothetical protein